MKSYTTNDFDYDLPSSCIAQTPCSSRSESRLLTLTSDVSENVKHQQFPDFVEYLNPADLLIFNDTKVIPARLQGKKQTGGKISCLIERILTDQTVLAHIRASHAPQVGSTLLFHGGISATVSARRGALFELDFSFQKETVLMLLEEHGQVPLPPYVVRAAAGEDKNRYQTVYAKNPGAVAAPTAGLHFDQQTLDALKKKGIEFGFLTLHIGAGTFQPVRVDNLDEHEMHSEYMVLSADLCHQIQACKARGGRVIAVGTTVVRALEAAAISATLQPFSGETSIFIRPGFQFQCVDALLTNFHLPKSTLLMLICAFGGYERVMSAYREAVAHKYRFYSYGDAMFLHHL